MKLKSFFKIHKSKMNTSFCSFDNIKINFYTTGSKETPIKPTARKLRIIPLEGKNITQERNVKPDGDRIKKQLAKQEEIQKRMEEDKKKYEFDNDQNPSTGEIGGPKGPEPTRYTDWSVNGKCTDF